MQFKKPFFWDNEKISFWSVILFPITIINLIIIQVIKIFASFKTYKSPSIPIICVGNIYLGGTGKTPLVREIFKITKSLGKNPAFIKKYYNFLSDEIKMLRDTGQIYIDNKRYKSITSAIQKNHNLAILDDGFQDFSVKPDFSILCFNSKQKIGNGFVIPSGPLREGLSAIQRADCIIINGNKDMVFEKKLLKNAGKKKLHIFYSNYKIKNLEKLKYKEIVAFAGIGNPTNFFELLVQNNLNIIKTYSFPDHYNYTNEDFEKMKTNNSAKIITTEKDYYRMNDLQKKFCDYVKVDLEIENKNKFEEIIKSYL
tara:strand:- start:1049 stop:1984 length:936 start_codon:yes stop_codon:yes gene_type:complete